MKKFKKKQRKVILAREIWARREGFAWALSIVGLGLLAIGVTLWPSVPECVESLDE